MQALAITAQGFHVVAGRRAKRYQGIDRVKLIEFTLSDTPQRLRTGLSRLLRVDTVENIFRACGPKGLNRVDMISRYAC